MTMIRTPWFELEPVMAAYVAAWTLAVVSALTHLWLKRRDYAEAYPGHGAFLLALWKVAFFALATALITWMAPYTTDPTWDRMEPTWLLPPTPGATTRILLWASPFPLLGAASLAYFADWGR